MDINSIQTGGIPMVRGTVGTTGEMGGTIGGGRPSWRISRKNTEGLFKFDGEIASYQSWKNRIRDHASEEWGSWREILDHAERVPHELKLEDLKYMNICGINGAQLSGDLWSPLALDRPEAVPQEDQDVAGHRRQWP